MQWTTVTLEIDRIYIKEYPIKKLHLTGHYLYAHQNLNPYGVADYILSTLNNHPILGPGLRWEFDSMTSGRPDGFQSFPDSIRCRTVVEYDPADESLKFVTQYDTSK